MGPAAVTFPTGAVPSCRDDGLRRAPALDGRAVLIRSLASHHLKRGFVRDDKLLRPEEVVVYRWKAGRGAQDKA